MLRNPDILKNPKALDILGSVVQARKIELERQNIKLVGENIERANLFVKGSNNREASDMALKCM
jgi:hypothetical protein